MWPSRMFMSDSIKGHDPMQGEGSNEIDKLEKTQLILLEPNQTHSVSLYSTIYR